MNLLFTEYTLLLYQYGGTKSMGFSARAFKIPLALDDGVELCWKDLFFLYKRYTQERGMVCSFGYYAVQDIFCSQKQKKGPQKAVLLSCDIINIQEPRLQKRFLQMLHRFFGKLPLMRCLLCTVLRDRLLS